LLFSIFINKKVKSTDVEELIKYINICEVPKFPISGEHLKRYGYVTGEELGKKLKLLEVQWIENNFTIDKKILEKSLGK
jgi:poly(A) polymerase